MSGFKMNQVKEAQETFQALKEVSNLLGTGLDVESLAICVRLCEAGVNPEVLSTVVSKLLKEVEAQKLKDAKTKPETKPDSQ